MMLVNFDIPEYDGRGIDVVWEKDAKYSLYVYGDTVSLKVNKQALVSLAKQMYYLSQFEFPKGSHVHYASWLTGSNQDIELILEIDEE